MPAWGCTLPPRDFKRTATCQTLSIRNRGRRGLSRRAASLQPTSPTLDTVNRPKHCSSSLLLLGMCLQPGHTWHPPSFFYDHPLTLPTRSAIFFAEFAVSVISCFETKEEREQRRERREEKRALKEYEESILRSPSMIPMTPAPPMTAGGMMTPYTPRTLAFNRLGGTSGDLPLRDHFSSPHPRRFHGEDAPPLASGAIGMAHPPSQSQPQPQPVPPEMYFPPPPKKAAK